MVGIYQNRIRTGLHFVAAFILLAYGVSHVGFIGLGDNSHDLQNLVFPFLTNRQLFGLAGVTEILLGLFCIHYKGRGFADILIVTFVALILWYRWAFYYNGGTDCGCTGLFGRLFHLKKVTERLLPKLSLVFLSVATIPGMFGAIRWSLRRYRLHVGAMLLFILSTAYSSPIIEIHGRVDLAEYSPVTGTPFTNQVAHSTFTATLSGSNRWRMSITNIDRPYWWAELAYDGVQTYMIGPSGGLWYSVGPSGVEYSTNTPPDPHLDQASIEGSPRYIPTAADSMGFYLVWFAYGLRPNQCKTNGLGLIDLPIPTIPPRKNLFAFGVKWIVTPGPDSRFAENCDIVTDKRLDLDPKSELLRSEFNYPETLSDYNEDIRSLKTRFLIPNETLKERYTCTNWWHTNEMTLPKTATLEVFDWFPTRPAHYPKRIVKLNTDTLTLRDAPEQIVPEISRPTRVEDFRYKRSTTKRIFKYAQYTLNSGDSWKTTNDAILLSDADNWIRNGRKYTDWVNGRRNFIAWLLLIALLSPAVITVILNKKQKNKRKEA